MYASDSYVSNFDNTVNKVCILCNIDNNIPHLFVDCVKVKIFWEKLKTRLSIVEGRAIPLKTIDIFGMVNSSRKSIIICILQAKWYIHFNKQENHALNLLMFFCFYEVY